MSVVGYTFGVAPAAEMRFGWQASKQAAADRAGIGAGSRLECDVAPGLGCRAATRGLL